LKLKGGGGGCSRAGGGDGGVMKHNRKVVVVGVVLRSVEDGRVMKQNHAKFSKNAFLVKEG